MDKLLIQSRGWDLRGRGTRQLFLGLGQSTPAGVNKLPPWNLGPFGAPAKTQRRVISHDVGSQTEEVDMLAGEV